jgi:mannose-6-phosphate isomerase-like protein (cupin superfamily)
MKAKRKPWGHEYLIYENDDVAIWHLFIDKWESTSLHCHPNKKTGLVVLCGGAKVSFLNGEQKAFSGEKVMIRHGVFHQTTNMTREGLQLFEIENPVNKADIVRLEDSYGRAGSPYGNEDEVDVPDKRLLPTGDWETVGDCDACIRNVNSLEDLVACSLVMIIGGGIVFNEHRVAGPGDVLDSQTFSSLAEKFSIEEGTSAVLIKENRNA